MKSHDNCEIGYIIFIVAALVCLMFGMTALLVRPANAHDHSRPDLTPWFEKLQSKGGAPCCDGKDGTSLDDPDWSVEGKTFKVRLDGKWYDVPEEAVVMDQNKAGHAVVWTYPIDGGQGYAIRCFMPGVLS